MKLRFDAHITFTTTGQQLGLPTWCAQNAAQIAAIAEHFEPTGEASHNTVDGPVWRAMLAVADNQVNRANLAQLAALVQTQSTHMEQARIRIHECRHDADPPQGCSVPHHDWRWPQ